MRRLCRMLTWLLAGALASSLCFQGVGALADTPQITEFQVASLAVAIITGPDGNLWFTDQVSDEIDKMTTDGVVTRYPLAPGGHFPEQITIGPDGNLWFTEPQPREIGKITTSGSITQYPMPTQDIAPGWITNGPDGNLWFTTSDDKIYKMTLQGAVTGYPVPSQFSQPRGIVTGPDRNLWFTESGRGQIGRITPAGVVTEYPLGNPFNCPTHITVGPDGNLWFTEGINYQGSRCPYSAVGKITTSGSVTEWAVPSRGEPGGIAAGPDGNLWFGGGGNTKLERITLGGSFTEYDAPKKAGGPEAVTVGSDGNIWFTEGATIDRFELSGSAPAPVPSGPPSAPAPKATPTPAGGPSSRLATAGWLLDQSPVPAGSQLVWDSKRSRLESVIGEWPGLKVEQWSNGSWLAVPTAGALPVLSGLKAVYDPARSRIVAIGNNPGGSFETWLFDGSRWQRTGGVRAPSARQDEGVAFNPVRNEVLLFGGRTAEGAALGDTWGFDGSNWQEISASPAPPPRSGAALMAGAPGIDLLLAGGQGQSGPLADTWAFDGSWHSLPATSLPAGSYTGIEDPAHQQAVLVGSDANGNWQQRVWFPLPAGNQDPNQPQPSYGFAQRHQGDWISLPSLHRPGSVASATATGNNVQLLDAHGQLFGGWFQSLADQPDHACELTGLTIAGKSGVTLLLVHVGNDFENELAQRSDGSWTLSTHSSLDLGLQGIWGARFKLTSGGETGGSEPEGNQTVGFNAEVTAAYVFSSGSTYSFSDQLAGMRGLVESLFPSPPAELTQAQTGSYSGGGVDMEGSFSIGYGSFGAGASGGGSAVLGRQKDFKTGDSTLELTVSLGGSLTSSFFVGNANGSKAATTQIWLVQGSDGSNKQLILQSQIATQQGLSLSTAPLSDNIASALTKGTGGGGVDGVVTSGDLVESTAIMDLHAPANQDLFELLGQSLDYGDPQQIAGSIDAAAGKSLIINARSDIQTGTSGFDFAAGEGIGVGVEDKSSTENAVLREAYYRPLGFPVDFPWLWCTS